MPRPYRFHVCANWLSAPPDHGIKKKSAPFPPDTAIGMWRDQVLTRPRRGFSKTPGEDFFYVQEVRVLGSSSLVYSNCLVCRCETSR
jgi:protein phosphatase PTC7